MGEDKGWLRADCTHDWRVGPLTDHLMRHRPAVCIKCWHYVQEMPDYTWGPGQFPMWTDEDYERHKGEVERRFFGESEGE